MSNSMRFKCIRCEGDVCNVGEMHVAGGFWSKVFDVEGRKFCRHTEFYQADRSQLANIFDLFVT